MTPAMTRVLLTTVLWCTATVASAPEAQTARVPRGWILHTMQEEQFQVALPREPTLRRSTVQTLAGPARLTGWIVDKGHEELAVVVTRLEPGLLAESPVDPQALLEGWRDEVVNGMRATLQSDRAFFVAGPPAGPSSYAAREFEVLLPNRTRVLNRGIVAGDRLIHLAFSGKGTSSKSFYLMAASFSFLGSR